MKLKKLTAVVLAVLLAISSALVCAAVGIVSDTSDEFKVLIVGNSLAQDMADEGYTQGSMMFDILKSMLGENCRVTIGVASKGGESMAYHATVAYRETAGAYMFMTFGDGQSDWKTEYGKSSKQVFTYADWDAVILEPYGGELTNGFATGSIEAQFVYPADSLAYMLDYTAKNAPNAKAYLYQVFGAPGVKRDADGNPDDPEYGMAAKSYKTIASRILELQDVQGTESGLKFTEVIPVGAAVQNARETYLTLVNHNSSPFPTTDDITAELDQNWGLHRDGLHLSLSIGRYIAGLCACEIIVPESMRVDNCKIPEMRASGSVGELPSEYSEIVAYSVNCAIEKMRAGGDSRYDVVSDVPAEYRTERLETLAAEASSKAQVLAPCADADAFISSWKNAIVADMDGYDVRVLITLDGDYSADVDTFTGTAVVTHGYSSTTVSVSAKIQSNPFTDIASGDWYYDHVIFSVANNLVNGMTDTTFEPATEMSRAMLVTVLWRLEGEPESSSTSTPFTDLVKDWYVDSVRWASENGIVIGIDDTHFAPEDKVTREQIAAILMRYAKMKNADVSERGSLDGFTDAAQISSYAKEAMTWAVGAKLINGSNDLKGNLRVYPSDGATRAEVVTILHRFIERYL